MRIYLRIVGCISISLCLMLNSCTNKEEPDYNILFIIADDMNEYGFFKTNPLVQTPSLDKFKETALSFRHTYCPAPACSPSRTSFLSGVSPHRSGKYYNGSEAWNKPLMVEQENVFEYFKRIGYDTYGKGKLFHSQIPKKRVDTSLTGNAGRAGFGPFPDSAHRIGNSRFKGLQAFPDEDFPDVKNANTIIELLQKDYEKPFFMMYGLWRPHSPYTCPQRFYDMYNIDDIEIPAGYDTNDTDDLPPLPAAYINLSTQRGDFKKITKTKEQWMKYLLGYYACYTFADWNIGRVLDALDSSKYASNTLVFVTSDNGFHMGEKDRFDKNGLWELSAITPMAVRVPGSKHAGKVCTKPVNLLDLYPTFVDFCGKGQRPLKEIDGISFKPLLENPELEWKLPSITYFGKGWIGMRSEQYRYIRYPDGTEELYDHSSDSWEIENLAHKKEFEHIKQEFQQYIPEYMEESIPGRWTTSIKRVEKQVLGKE